MARYRLHHSLGRRTVIRQLHRWAKRHFSDHKRFRHQKLSDALLVAFGVLAGLVLMVLLAIASTGFTRTAESAQITTLPFIAAVVGSFFWTAFDDGFAFASRLTPGGALQNLLMTGWGVEPVGASTAGAAVVLLAWTVLPYQVAARRFRWEKR